MADLEKQAREVLAKNVAPSWREGIISGVNNDWGHIRPSEAIRAMLAFLESHSTRTVEQIWRAGFREARYLFDPSVSIDEPTPEEDDFWELRREKLTALAFRAAQPVEGASCTCLVAFGQDEECPAHGIGTAWRADNPEADMRASPAALTTPPAGRPEDLPTAERHQDTLPIVGSHQGAPAGRPEKEARPDRREMARAIQIAVQKTYTTLSTFLDEDEAMNAADAALAFFPTDDGSREERMREALGQAAADFEEHAAHAQTRIEDGDELGPTVWKIALGDIKREALDNAARCRAALSDPQEQERGR